MRGDIAWEHARLAINRSSCLISVVLMLAACTPKPPPYDSREILLPSSTIQSAPPGQAMPDSPPTQASFIDEFDRPDTTSGLGDGWDMRGMPQNGQPLLPAADGYIKDGHFTYAGKSDAIAVRQFRSPVTSIGAEGQFRRINPANTDTTMMLGTGGDNNLETNVVVFLANRSSWELRSRLVSGTLKTVASGTFAHMLELGHVYQFVLSCTGDRVGVTGPGLTISKPLPIPISTGAFGFWRESPNRIPAGEVFDFDKVWALEDGQPTMPTTASAAAPEH
ncbi:hypothetical protein [Mycolicibacterium sp. CBMA 234]|uniref:hypothetical protein n=1 Tax=Mycolicibacterium sp. CBMA 234 TaxID=1918495 RepID=UPI0012DD0557|nr:hypothetical protein [Mycolicibacterium sp. CBMA 234]